MPAAVVAEPAAVAAAPAATSAFRRFGIHRLDLVSRSERCGLCPNDCRLRIVDVGGEEVAYGFLCGRDYAHQALRQAQRSGGELLRRKSRAIRKRLPRGAKGSLPPPSGSRLSEYRPRSTWPRTRLSGRPSSSFSAFRLSSRSPTPPRCARASAWPARSSARRWPCTTGKPARSSRTPISPSSPSIWRRDPRIRPPRFPRHRAPLLLQLQPIRLGRRSVRRVEGPRAES